MMKVLLKILSVLFLFSSCYTVDKDLEGRWKSTFIAPEFVKMSKVYFNGFDLFEKSIFEPVIYFFGDTLLYDLGFGRNGLRFYGNYSKIIVKDGRLEIFSGSNSEVFDLIFLTSNDFCLSKDGEQLACFTRLKSISDQECGDYSLSLQILDEYYDIRLQLSPSKGQIIRAGLKSDTIVFKVNDFDEKFIRRLINSINDENFNPQRKITGGDYLEYAIKLNCGDKIYAGKLYGLKGVSFELHALVQNLDNYIRSKFD